jgi:uncharacterized membrane protein
MMCHVGASWGVRAPGAPSARAALAYSVAFHPWLSGLHLRRRALANRLRESLLVIPSVMVVVAALLERWLAQLDRRLPADQLPFLLRMSPEATISLLSTIAGATITTVGVVFSLIVITLQLASGQFSPRVLRTYFRDWTGQVLVGLLAALFTYCVLCLRAVRPAIGEQPLEVPDLAVNMAVLLTLVSVIVLVAFLHRLARRQYVGNVIAEIADETLARFPDVFAGRSTALPEAPCDVDRLGPHHVVRSVRSGWVQQMSSAGLLAAVPAGGVGRVETRVGAYIFSGSPLMSIWPPPERPRAAERDVRREVVIGPARTMQQDIDFGLRQLTDIALRALSPAVNDPTTAIEVLFGIASILRLLLLTDLPSQVRRDQRGSVLLRPWDLDHSKYVRHGFTQFRHYGASDPAVAVALVRTLRMLVETAERAGRKEAVDELHHQISLTLEECDRAGLLPDELAAVHAGAAAPRERPEHVAPAEQEFH